MNREIEIRIQEIVSSNILMLTERRANLQSLYKDIEKAKSEGLPTCVLDIDGLLRFGDNKVAISCNKTFCIIVRNSRSNFDKVFGT